MIGGTMIVEAMIGRVTIVRVTLVRAAIECPEAAR
jgi:hypothetical protein